MFTFYFKIAKILFTLYFKIATVTKKINGEVINNYKEPTIEERIVWAMQPNICMIIGNWNKIVKYSKASFSRKREGTGIPSFKKTSFLTRRRLSVLWSILRRRVTLSVAALNWVPWWRVCVLGWIPYNSLINSQLMLLLALIE